ncbi:toxic anion resistance protein [Anaerolineales bacterium HSG6]|nr:toxic anion resistance protein [Anaerolineales bacterium HSG6]
MELTAPESLQAPEPVKAVEREQADGMVKLDNTTLDRLDAKATEFVEAVLSEDAHTEAFKKKVNTIHNMGNKEIRASAEVSNRLLDKPVNSLKGGIFDEQSPVSSALTELRKKVEELDPSKQGNLFTPQKFLGFIPYGNKINDYFEGYQNSQTQIDRILNTLNRSQDELRKDNAAIEQEKVNLWNTMQRIQEYVYVGKEIDKALEARVAEIELTDPEKARIVKEEMLFYVRQKVQDLLTQLAVSIQGYLALDMVRKNNLELIKGVDRASTTTISALRTAVIVAQALTNQRLVLDQINALNTTTSNLVEATSVMLKQQSAETYKQASSSTVELEKLQSAFNNIYETMDMVSTYKLEALDNMKETVDVLTTEVGRANTYLDRVRQEEAARATGDIDLLGG